MTGQFDLDDAVETILRFTHGRFCLALAQMALGSVRRFGDRFEDAYACITHGLSLIHILTLPTTA